ncbi:putative inorganic phosphate cotransporter [Diabrotica virgifera virgifera]|uniref:Inorganic phosphate cotransporter n=1 Tax=Diabrotica virgifera virgifera TaxID=50390 RepID=A0A6P7F858_DIAVI|nr:putative inorganic phosphate cotransporter [Diabrotica virgifera virgifera]XP_050512282.1 putative inorganic phosphate cotransporter [Diabrotica virgifera virgifera]XP_050512283.1 putative inorganic phosphate cotransporter [Diabrotica virgifera virgifera]
MKNDKRGVMLTSLSGKAMDEEKQVDHSTELLSDNVENVAKVNKIGKRHWQVLNICFLIFAAYYSRNSLPVAIVAMNDRNSTINSDIPTFNWTNKNVVISAFFFGYVPGQIITSWVITKVGVKWFGVCAMAICSLVGMITPQVAMWFGYKGVIAVRVIQGLTQGFAFPSVQHLLGAWVPPNERAGLGGTVYSARPIATVMCMLFSGYIAASWSGWPMVFYSSNIIGLVWCLSFALFSHDTPAAHPSITTKERIYIEKSLGSVTIAQKKQKIPWKHILMSGPFWAVSIAQAGFSWCFWTLQTQTPMYMKYVMKFNIENSGTLSALPYLAQWIACFMFSFTSDYLLNKNFWSITTARKVMNSIGMFIPAIILIFFANTGPEQSTLAVILLIFGVAINGATFCGFMINQVDLSPNYASILVGISNGPGQVTGFLAPLFVQAIVKDETNPLEWRYVFYTSGGVYILSGIVFIVFGSGKVQYWDDLEEHKRKQRINP